MTFLSLCSPTIVTGLPFLGYRAQPPKVLLMTYASGEIFQKTQRLMDESLHIAEIVDHLKFNESEWESGERFDWYHKHAAG